MLKVSGVELIDFSLLGALGTRLSKKIPCVLIFWVQPQFPQTIRTEKNVHV